MLTLDANIWIAAYEPQDRFHKDSVAFLTTVARRQTLLYGPAFVTVEAGCAVARRTQDARAGSNASRHLKSYPLLTLLPLGERLLILAAELGVRYLVRGADALYVATAAMTETPLISWDSELITRAGALTPASWLATDAA